MAMPIALGSERPGSFASPPACAMESNPMKLAKRRAEAERNVFQLNSAVVAGTVLPSLIIKADAKSSWVNIKPATITIPPSTNMRIMRGTTVFSYDFTPRMLIRTNVHRMNKASIIRTDPVSSICAISFQCNAEAMSRKKGMIT